MHVFASTRLHLRACFLGVACVASAQCLQADPASGQELGQEAPSSGNMTSPSFASSCSSASYSAAFSGPSSSSSSFARMLPERVRAANNEVIELKQREWFESSREWLFEEVRQWLRSGKRLCWLVGGAGTGKSVVSARLLLTEGVREHVKAWHFCRHDNAAGSDVSVILQSWSAMLANHLAGFEAVSLDDENQAGAIVESKGQAMPSSNKVLSAREMFKLLIADPLARMETLSLLPLSSEKSPCVIVLDALDELPRGSVTDVLQLLAEEFDKLPSCVRLFVASEKRTFHCHSSSI